MICNLIWNKNINDTHMVLMNKNVPWKLNKRHQKSAVQLSDAGFGQSSSETSIHRTK